jgi:hypothetical protein
MPSWCWRARPKSVPPGLELLRQGMAPRLFLDAETRESDLRSATDRHRAEVCEYAFRKRAASRCARSSAFDQRRNRRRGRCLQSLGAHRVLLVTSDYHTRRALMIFRHRLPQYQFSVAAAGNPAQFGRLVDEPRMGKDDVLTSGRSCSGGRRWIGGGSECPVPGYPVSSQKPRCEERVRST